MNDILADRVLVDLIRQIDRIRGDFERAGDHELAGLRMLIDSTLRAAVTYLAHLREDRLGP